MVSSPTPKQKTTALNTTIAGVLLLAIFMGAMMWFSTTYPFPSGQSFTVFEFILFWFRELALLLMLLLILGAWVVTTVRKKLSLNGKTLSPKEGQ